MKTRITFCLPVFVISLLFSIDCFSADMDEVIGAFGGEISGNRARDYTMRLWRYDKWSTLPMWRKTAMEAKTIMEERGFDEAEIVNTPADGVTTFGAWTNPIGWDCKGATLEIVEPEDVPEEFRRLCDYLDNPTSLNNYSCPTPPEGIEAELVLLEKSDPGELAKLDARGKIILVSSGSRAMKRHLDRYGVLGIVSDEIEEGNSDFINANQWLNGWSDLPGGWQMNASDSKNNFGFSISQKKGKFLRDLLRSGVTVRVRAKIDSRYFTDDYLPYVVGAIEGTSRKDEDVLVVSHIFEWGANDDCTGASIDLEALGTLNDLIREGVLPRPKRTVRMWLGFECYGSMAYTVHNLERMRTKTLAALCCDTPADDYDLYTSSLLVASNFNACPSFTDAVLPELVGRYYSRYSPNKLWKKVPFMSGFDNFFGDPMIGVPINIIYADNGGHLHHNSMDTIGKVDPRTLREIAVITASYLYYLADADEGEVPFVTRLVFDRAIGVITDKAAEMKEKALAAGDGETLGRVLVEGVRTIEYYTGLQQRVMDTVERIAAPGERKETRRYVAPYRERIGKFGALMVEDFRDTVKRRAKAESVKMVRYAPEETEWEKEAASLVPKRKFVGTMTLEQVPVDEWVEVKSSPRWWSATNWASASYFWCDGERNLKEIRDLVELEAGRPVENFDLIKYYRFLEKHGMIEFVK